MFYVFCVCLLHYLNSIKGECSVLYYFVLRIELYQFFHIIWQKTQFLGKLLMNTKCFFHFVYKLFSKLFSLYVEFSDISSCVYKACSKKTELFKKRASQLGAFNSRSDISLRLLNAPSVRFWQQTAICLVSLWALVVQLHPLNWARAQTVRPISDKVTMKEIFFLDSFYCILSPKLDYQYMCGNYKHRALSI